jgi:CRP/FNR family cyclic AMP-dependent transcriptional regulator
MWAQNGKVVSDDCQERPPHEIKLDRGSETKNTGLADLPGRTIQIPAGAIPMHEGTPGDYVLFVCSGELLISCVSRSGKRLNLKLARSGEVIGLSAAIAGVAFETTATALTPSKVKIIDRASFLQFLASHKEAAAGALLSLASSYGASLSNVRSISLCDTAAGRIAKLLLEWGRPVAGDETITQFNMTFTHKDLADFAVTTRETVSRTLRRFQRENLVEIRGICVRILSPEGLSKLIV